MTTDYLRGQRDSNRFDHVRQVGGNWEATLDGFADPISLGDFATEDYLRGLADSGCDVTREVERRATRTIDTLLERIAFVMQ